MLKIKCALENNHILLVIWLCICLVFTATPGRSKAAVGESPQTDEKALPASFELTDIWFYDQNRVRRIPVLDPDWVVAVIEPLSGSHISQSDPAADEVALLQVAQTIVDGYDDIIDAFYDRNLASKACFLKLRDGSSKAEVMKTIADLNQNPWVRYAHPTLRIKNKTYAYLNHFKMKWKTGVAREQKHRLMHQAHVTPGSVENLYQVDVFGIPFFKAVNLLAEDIHILWTSPRLIELTPSIRAELQPAMTGGRIGERIPFAFRIIRSDTIQVEPSSIANLNLRPLNLQKELFDLKLDPYDYVSAAAQSAVQISGWMKLYAPGDYVIPSLVIKYSCTNCLDNQVRTLKTKPVSIKVSSIVPARQADKKLILPQANLQPEDKSEFFRIRADLHRLISVASFVCASFCVIWFIAALKKVRRQQKHLLEIKRVDTLAEKLTLHLKALPSGQHWRYMAEVGRLLRAYIVEKYQIREYAAQGSGRVFSLSVQPNLPEALFTEIENVFEEIDNAAAQELDIHADIETFRTKVLKLITKSNSN